VATINDLVSRIKYRLSRQQDSSIDARIVAELAAAQESFEGGTTLPWFLNVQLPYEVSNAHDNFSVLNFPDFLRIAEDDYALRVEDLTQTDETLLKLSRQDTYEKLIGYLPGTADATTLPVAYCILGNTIHIRKKQVVTRNYYLSYFRKDQTIPAANVSTLWSTYVPDLLAAEAGIQVAQYLRDTAAIKFFMGLRSVKFAELVRRNQAVQDADQNYVMGE